MYVAALTVQVAALKKKKEMVKLTTILEWEPFSSSIIRRISSLERAKKA